MTTRLAHACVLVLILMGAAISAAQAGRLEAGDAQLSSGEYFDVHEFSGNGGDRVEITLRSTEFDPYLAIVHPIGDVVLEVDDSEGQGLDVVEVFVLPVDGVYQIVVTSAYAGGTGAYLLTIAASAATGPTAPRVRSIAFGQGQVVEIGAAPSTVPEPVYAPQ